jgi:hypothetical protein
MNVEKMKLKTQIVSCQRLWMNWSWPTTTSAEQTADVLKSGKVLTVYGDIRTGYHPNTSKRVLPFSSWLNKDSLCHTKW